MQPGGAYDPTNFAVKSPEQWENFKQFSAGSTQNINRMPFVFNNYNQRQLETPTDIKNYIYGPNNTGIVSAQGGSYAPQPAAASPLQTLLGLINSGNIGTLLGSGRGG